MTRKIMHLSHPFEPPQDINRDKTNVVNGLEKCLKSITENDEFVVNINKLKWNEIYWLGY